VTLHTTLPRRSLLSACPIALQDTSKCNFVYILKKSRPTAFLSPIFTNLWSDYKFWNKISLEFLYSGTLDPKVSLPHPIAHWRIVIIQKKGMLSYTASKTSKLAKEVYFRTDSATDDRHRCLRLVDSRLKAPPDRRGAKYSQRWRRRHFRPSFAWIAAKRFAWLSTPTRQFCGSVCGYVLLIRRRRGTFISCLRRWRKLQVCISIRPL
jgi:hypothetical protein